MWADVQHDGRPSEGTWRPLLNAVDQMAKITKPGCKTHLNLLGVPQTPKDLSR